MFLVRDTHASAPGRLLALKILLPSLASNEDFLRMFFTEAKIAARLQHPNVVGITGFGQVDGIHCLAMEYVFGASLAQVLRASARAKKPLTVGVLLRITSQVCDALHYAHELRDDSGENMGLVHRDVTPQNILVGFNGVPKLTDFGIAKATNRGWETQAGIVKGKFSYMSPEQALGKKVDRRSDIFGTGIVLWEALTGRDLFKGSTPMEVLTAIREQKIQPPSKVVPGLTPIVDPIVMKALRRSPRQRYQTAAEMRDDIEDLIRRAGVNIDKETISKEFAAIYGETIVERAFVLRAAMAGKGALDHLAKVLGGSKLEQKHLPEIRGGVNDPDPLGLFTQNVPDNPEDAPSALPARAADFDEAEVDDFDIVDGSEPQDDDDDDLVPFESDEQRNAEDLVPQERIVNGWEDSTAMSVPAKDELLSMISEEDATIGYLPPEFAERFGRDLQAALDEGDEEAHFDDERTVGMPSLPELSQLRSIHHDPREDPYPEPPIQGARTEALPSSYGLDPSPRSGQQLRPLPRAPSLDMERPVPRAPSLDMDGSTPPPELEPYDPTDEPPLPSRPPPRTPPPPPPGRTPQAVASPALGPVPPLAPSADSDEVPASMPGEVVMLGEEGYMPEAPPIPPRKPSIPPPPAGTPDPSQGPLGLEAGDDDPLAPDKLRALAAGAPDADAGAKVVLGNVLPGTPIPSDAGPGAAAPISGSHVAEVAPPAATAEPIGALSSAPHPTTPVSQAALADVPEPPRSGVQVSPMFLVVAAVLLIAVGAAVGLAVATL